MIRTAFVALAFLLVSSSMVLAQPRLVGITGNLGIPNDETLYEFDLTDYLPTELGPLTFIPDEDAIAFNPDTGLLHHLSGDESYSNNPFSNGYRDNQYMETVDVLSGTLAKTAIFNSNSEKFGLPASPKLAFTGRRRTDAQTSSAFRVRGPDEYGGLRDLTWSSTENLFYGADEYGLFRLTADGQSTFVAPPSAGADLAGITFFNINENRVLLASDLNGPQLRTLDPMTGAVVGEPVLIKDPFNPALPLPASWDWLSTPTATSCGESVRGQPSSRET